MMPEDISRKALDAHLQGYVTALRESLSAEGKPCDESVIDALADMYWRGWIDADGMFRAWGMTQ
jgi:hypothetical protein